MKHALEIAAPGPLGQGACRRQPRQRGDDIRALVVSADRLRRRRRRLQPREQRPLRDASRTGFDILDVVKGRHQAVAGQLTQKASDYFNAIFKHPEAQGIAVTAAYAYSSGGSHVINMTSTANVPTEFMRVLGYETIKIAAKADSAWGGTRIRVALALDTTGSMADAGKMAALKPAAKKLISILQNTAKMKGDVFTSIVPFTKDVNVGSSNYNQTWIKWNAWDDANGTCSTRAVRPRSTLPKQ